MASPRKRPPPWERPDPRTIRGDASAADIFHAVGLALSAWEVLEEELALIFASLIQSDDSVPSMRAYGSIATSRGRNEMLAAAADAYFIEAPSAHLQRKFKTLMPAVQGLAARRNDIAHGIVRALGPDSYALMPPTYMTNKVKWGPAGFTLSTPT